MINDKLFESQDFILTAIDFEKDPKADAAYSLNLRYQDIGVIVLSSLYPKTSSRRSLKR